MLIDHTDDTSVCLSDGSLKSEKDRENQGNHITAKENIRESFTKVSNIKFGFIFMQPSFFCFKGPIFYLT